MPESASHPPDDLEMPGSALGVPRSAPPLHGYRGDALDEAPGQPVGLTITISRETGSRGSAIAQQAGAKLGWQVWPQELLEFVTQDAAARQEILDDLPPGGEAWAEAHLHRLLRAESVSSNPSIVDLTRLLLYLGVRGEAVLVGRGAGTILPAHSTLNVRIVAPPEDRIAYIAQWQRLTEEAAAEHVARLDRRRADFVATHFHRDPTDAHQYDLVLNSSRLGEERCADLIVHAARSKLAALGDGTEEIAI